MKSEDKQRHEVVASASDGTIALCPHQGCGFTCCEFQQGNYIVLYPGELEAASEAGTSLKHLKITERYHGGFKAICTAKETATCDNGYKPLDCKSYPYFPLVRDAVIIAGLKGKKCPLTVELTEGHARFVEREWRLLAIERPEVVEWLKRVALVGYEQVARGS
jgi:hypothetical protein